MTVTEEPSVTVDDHVLDAGNVGDRVLDLLRHLALELGRGGARLRHGDGDDRHVDVGKARHGELS